MRTWTALLLAFALVTCGTAVVVATAGDGADGADTTVEYTKVFNTDGPETVSIDTHESELDGDPTVDSYQVQWKYSDGGAWQDLVLGQDYTVGDWKFNLVKGTDGIYDVTLSTDEIASKTEIRLNCSISITYKPEAGGGTVTETADIILKISKNGTLPSTIRMNSFEFYADTAISKTEGKIVPIDENESEMSNDFNWFAFDLPEGMSMTADGHFSGIPMMANDTYMPYKVYAENPFGNIGAYDVYIWIFERDENQLEFWVHRGDISGFDPSTSHRNPKVSAVQHGDVVRLIINKGAMVSTDLKVSVIDPDAAGNRKIIVPEDTGAYLVYILPTGVTGAYGVIIDFSSNITRTLVYVLPQLEVVIAGIGVSSSSTTSGP